MDPSVNFDIPIFKSLPEIIINENRNENDVKNLENINIIEIQDKEPFINKNLKINFTFILVMIILLIYFFKIFFNRN